MNLTGKWNFKEDFAFGYDEGIAHLTQTGNNIEGSLTFTETIENEFPFEVKCQLKGEVIASKVILNVITFEILSPNESIEYFPEQREGIINANGQIVGSSEDEQGICGVFVFERCNE